MLSLVSVFYPKILSLSMSSSSSTAGLFLLMPILGMLGDDIGLLLLLLTELSYELID